MNPEGSSSHHGRHPSRALVTAYDDGVVVIHAGRIGDARTVRDDALPSTHLELTRDGPQTVISADWRAFILDRLATSWAAHPDMRLGQLLTYSLEHGMSDPCQVAIHQTDRLADLLYDVQDEDLGLALDRYVDAEVAPD